MATKVPEPKVDLVAKEIELIKLLASNDPNTRSDGIKQIKRLLLGNSDDTSDAFQLNDYLIIWRGLFYFMWMSDKPVSQESVTEKISYLIHSCTSYQGKIFFLDAFFLTIKDNWMSIKQHRIDQCMMWVRHFLRQLLFTFVNCDWNLGYMNKFSEVLYRALKSFTLSLRTHLQVIFLEELAKVSRGKVPSEALVIILESFLHYISELNDVMLIREVTQNVFRNLLSPLPDSETLEAKFQALQKKIDPGNSNNDLELVEGDITNDDSNEINDSSLDLQARNVSVEIPRIKINLKDVIKVLNKYLTEVDCTRKCLLEITKLIQFYNRLGNCTLPNKPKDLNLNNQVLKHKQKKYLSKMVKEGIKKLEMVDSRIKKSGLEVYDHKSLKELNKMGEIVVKRGIIGKFMWKVRHFDNGHTFKNNLNLNNSWTVSQGKTNTVCINNDKPQILVPPGFSVEVLESSEKTPTKVQNKVSITPNFKSLTIDSSLKESNSIKCKRKSKILKINDATNKKNVKNQNSSFINNGTPHDLHASHKRSISADHGGSASKKIKNIEFANAAQSINAPFNEKIFTPDNEIVEKNQIDDLVLSKVKLSSNEININSSLNCNRRTCSDEKFKLSKCKSLVSNIANEPNEKRIQKSNSPIDEICSPNIVNINDNNIWSISADNDGSVSNTVEKSNSSSKIEKEILLTSLITAGKSSESPKSPTFEPRVLRQRTSILPMNEPNGQNEGTPTRKIKKISAAKVLHERRTTIPGSKPGKADKGISLTSVIRVGKSSESPKSPAFEQRILRRRTTIIPMNTPAGQNGCTPTRKIKKISAAKVLHERRTTISGSKPGKADKGISLTSIITAGKNSESPKSPTFEPRVLRQRTSIIPMNKPNGKNEGTPTRKIKKISAAKVLHERRTTISGSKPGKADKGISLTSVIRVGKSSESPKSPAFEQRILRRRTTIIPMNTPAGQNGCTPTRKIKKISAAKVLHERRTTISGSKPGKADKGISLTSVIRVGKSSESPKSPAFEQRILRRRTTIIPMNTPAGQNECTLKRKVKENSAAKVLHERRKTITSSKPGKVEKGISLTSVIRVGKSSESPKSPAFEQRILRRRTTIIPMNTPAGQNGCTLRRKVKETSAAKVLHERRTTIPGSKPGKADKGISLTSIITAGKNSESPKSPTFEQRILRRRTTIIPMNTPAGQNECTLKRKVKENSAAKVLHERRKTITSSKPGKVEKGILLTSVMRAGNSSKSPKSPAFEQRILQRRTTIIPMNTPAGQNECTLRRKVKETSAAKVLHERRKTITSSKPGKADKGISLTFVIRVGKSSESPKSPAFEQRILRRRTTIITMNTPAGQNGCTLRRKVKETSAAKVLHERRTTIPGSKPGKADKGISLTSIITAGKNSESPKSPTFEPRVLRQRTSILPMNEPNGQNEGTPTRKIKKISAAKVLHERRTTIPGSKPGKADKGISLTSVIRVGKSSKSPKSPAFEQRILRRRTTIIPMNTPAGQNECTLRRKVKETSAAKVLYERRTTIPGSKPGKADKGISLTSIITAGKNSESPKSPTFEPRVLRQRTSILPMNKPNGQNEGTPTRKIKKISAAKVLHERRTTIPGSKPGKADKSISLTSIITAGKNSESPKSPAFEQRILRRRTTIIPMNKPAGQNESTLRRKVKESSGMRVLQKCKDTLAGEEISMLRPEEISNKALEEVRTVVFKDGFGSVRRSPRLSIKTDFDKKKN